MCMEGPGETTSSIMPIVSNKPHQQSSCQHLMKSHLYVKLNSNRCIPLCEADIMFDAQEKHLAETWINSWSIAALFLAILATLCLILSNARWDKKLMVRGDIINLNLTVIFEIQL
jgi:frizzled 4